MKKLILHIFRSTTRHKLNRLIQQNQATDQQAIIPPQQSRVTNLTSVNFTQPELNILNKGLKYSTCNYFKKQLEELSIDTEIILNNIPDQTEKISTTSLCQSHKKLQSSTTTPTSTNQIVTLKKLSSGIVTNNLILL